MFYQSLITRSRVFICPFQVITMQDTFVSNEFPPSSIKIFHFLYISNNYLPIRKYNTNTKQIHPNTSTFSYSSHIPIWKFTNLHHLNALESQASSDIHHPSFRFGMWLGCLVVLDHLYLLIKRRHLIRYILCQTAFDVFS